MAVGMGKQIDLAVTSCVSLHHAEASLGDGMGMKLLP